MSKSNHISSREPNRTYLVFFDFASTPLKLFLYLARTSGSSLLYGIKFKSYSLKIGCGLLSLRKISNSSFKRASTLEFIG